MNSLIQTKTMVSGHRSAIRQYCCFKLWYSTNKINGSLALIYMGKRDPRNNRLLMRTALMENCNNYNNNLSYVQLRTFYVTPTWKGQESSKVKDAVKNIKEQKELKAKTDESVVKSAPKAIVEKRTIWQKVKGELLHYYHGFRLLGLDMKISVKLLWRILKGKELSRREHRLLIKTTGDVFRLIPFSVFIIVPFMEFLLPVVIKVFPGMLPSTFQTATEKEDKLKQALKIKIEMAKFLQKTLDDMAVQSDYKSKRAKEFTDFFYKVRNSGTVASNEEIMQFSKLFEDEITLDSLTRPQLVALCRVLDVQTLGTTNFLKFLLRMRLRSLTADDKLIEKEGIDSLTRSELQQACRARGMRAYGMPDSRLKEQLSQWLDLSLTKKVPPSLLLLSRALMVPETIPMTDKLKATISALPETVVARTQCAIGEKEGTMDHKTNIEIIKMEERKIEEERQEKEPEPDVHEQKVDEITNKDVKVLEQALDSVAEEKEISVEKEEIKELKEDMADYQEDLKEFYEIKAAAKGEKDIDSIKVSTGAVLLFKQVNKMIHKMDKVLTELESKKQIKQSEKKEKADVEGSTSKTMEELVKIDELISAIRKMQNVPDQHRLQRITEILAKIDDDRDGAIKIDDVLKVLELIGKEDIKLSKKQVDELLELIDKEEIIETDEQIQKILQKEASEELKDEQCTATKYVEPKSPVPATPVTTEKGFGKEELNEDIPDANKGFAVRSSESEKEKSAAVLKSNSSSDSVRNPPLTPGVPPPAKKAEGSKQL